MINHISTDDGWHCRCWVLQEIVWTFDIFRHYKEDLQVRSRFLVLIYCKSFSNSLLMNVGQFEHSTHSTVEKVLHASKEYVKKWINKMCVCVCVCVFTVLQRCRASSCTCNPEPWVRTPCRGHMAGRRTGCRPAHSGRRGRALHTCSAALRSK